MEEKSILVVTLPSSMAETVEELRSLRDYFVESIRTGVMVIDGRCTHKVVELPTLGGVHIFCGCERSDFVLRARAEVESEDPAVELLREHSTPKTMKEKEEIMERLKKYREVHGLGCLKDVAKRAGERITDDMLRSLLVGEATASLSDWRRIGTALNKLEHKA